MKSKKYKTRDKWKKLINDKLTPEEFQDLCYDIIKNNGFSNPQFRGKGGDGGRDIKAEFSYSVGKQEKREECWFQAKKQKLGVNFNQFSTEVQKAEDQGIKRFFIVSNSDTTPHCKDDIENWNKKHRCEINDWTGTKFLDLLFELPHICNVYFPDEEVPPLVDMKNPQTLIQQSSDLGKRFGIELHLKTDKMINPNNPQEIADVLKESLINLNKIDINLKALLYQKISMFFFSLERYDDALMFLNKSLEITPKNIEALLKKGFILEKIDDIEASTTCYNEILKTDSTNKFALNNKAHNYRRKGKLEEALLLVNKALEVDKCFIVAIQTKVNILKSLDKVTEALGHLEKHDKLLEKSTVLQQSKVDLYIELLDLKKAFELNEKILKKEPNNVIAINDKGVIYEKNSKYQYTEKYLKLALECFDRTITINKKFPIGWSNKTVVFINSGNVKKAEEIIDLAYAFFPKHPHILNKKGVIFLVKNRPKDALKYFKKALKLHYYDEFLINRAKALLTLRQWRKAISDAERLLKLNPKNSDAWKIKAQASYELHEPTKAKNYAHKAEMYRKKPISLLED